MRPRLLLNVLFAIGSSASLHAQPVVRDNDVIAFVGDSITEQKLYSVYLESYLLMCQPAKVRCVQFGWSGETTSGFNTRIDDVLRFKPTLVTTCYGMNDGRYVPPNEGLRQNYRDQTQRMVETFVKNGIRVVVGSPGLVDTGTFTRSNGTTAVQYNNALGLLAQQARLVAEAKGQVYADVHQVMADGMAAMKAKYGNKFEVAGRDGIHPGPDGHVLMAYAFLKAMKFTGDIGTFEVDLIARKATATDGHKVIKLDGNTATFESTRYPFCFSGKKGDPNATATVVDFLPFNDELNRLTLKVRGDAAFYKVTWGTQSITVSADRIATGINLATEFIENPFSKPFDEALRAVAEKQGKETEFTKRLVRTLTTTMDLLPEQKEHFDAIFDGVQKAEVAFGEKMQALVKPVTHQIVIEPADER